MMRNWTRLSALVALFSKRSVFRRLVFRWYRLTNDFARYCDLLVEEYRRGYWRFFAECQAGDHSKADRDRLRSEGAQEVLSVYARRYLQGV